MKPSIAEEKADMATKVNGDHSCTVKDEKKDVAADEKKEITAEEMTSKDYYFDSYAHFGKLIAYQV